MQNAGFLITRLICSYYNRILHENLPAKELQRRGVCLLGLNISSRKTGFYGRILVAFDTDKEALPSHSITPGIIWASL